MNKVLYYPRTIIKNKRKIKKKNIYIFLYTEISLL